MTQKIPAQKIPRQTMFIPAEVVLSYLMNSDDKVDTMITCQDGSLEFFTTDQDLYEALGSIPAGKHFNERRLVKFLEGVTVMPYKDAVKKNRTILTDARVYELRGKAGLTKDDKK